MIIDHDLGVYSNT